VSYQHWGCIEYLLGECEVSANPKTENGVALLPAVFNYQPKDIARLEKIVKILISHDADVNAKGLVDRTVLLQSMVHGYTSITSILLDNGANPNIPDKDGLLPIHMCATYSNLPILQQILAKGANVDGQDCKHRTPLYFAILTGHHEIFNELIRQRCDINLGSRYGTPLQTAIIKHRLRMVQTLLHHGVDVQCKIVEHRQIYSKATDYLNLALIVAHYALINHWQCVGNHAEELKQCLQILNLIIQAIGKPNSFVKNAFIKSIRQSTEPAITNNPLVRHINQKLSFIHKMSERSKVNDGLPKLDSSINTFSLQNICRVRVRGLIASRGTNVVHVVDLLDCSNILKDLILLGDIMCTSEISQRGHRESLQAS
jgi:ankyrin repeat protein